MSENISKLKEMIKESNKIVITPTEYQSVKQGFKDFDDSRSEELLLKREKQEQKINESLNILGTLNNTAKNMVTGAKEKCSKLLESLNGKSSIIEDSEEIVSNMDKTYNNLTNSDIISIEEDKSALLTVPTDITDYLSQQDLIHLEEDKGESRKLTPSQQKKGSIFSSILVIITTISIGLLTAIILIK